MHEQTPGLIASVWALAGMLLFLFWWVLAAGAILGFWSIVRNLARTRRALERIADAVEGPRTPSGGGILGI